MDKTFLGRGWAFPPQFNKTNVRMVEAEEDIQQSLYVLLSTTPGERVMQPEYGCRLKLYVFGSLNTSTIATIIRTVKQAILFFEPRIIVDKVDVNDEEKLEGKLMLNIHYVVRTTNNRYNLVYPFYFNEGTNV